MTNHVWSYRLRRNIGFALVDSRYVPGDDVRIIMDGRPVAGRLVESPFIRKSKSERRLEMSEPGGEAWRYVLLDLERHGTCG